jgi:hypothetical protein
MLDFGSIRLGKYVFENEGCFFYDDGMHTHLHIHAHISNKGYHS